MWSKQTISAAMRSQVGVLAQQVEIDMRDIGQGNESSVKQQGGGG
jgi:hypothetical protein